MDRTELLSSQLQKWTLAMSLLQALVRAWLALRQRLTSDADLTQIMKTSNSAVRLNTQSSTLNQVMVGQVPDRGGRTGDARAPPKMPSFRAVTS